MVLEIKLDNCFPVGQFLIDVYDPPIRLDRGVHGGALMISVRKDIPCKLLLWKINPWKAFT